MNTKKTLKKMSKLELVELLAEQERQIQFLKQQLEEKDKVIQQRTLKLNEFGNIAQAALAINEVFETAQRAADQYVDSIKTVVEERLQQNENSDERMEKMKVSEENTWGKNECRKN